MNDSTHLSFHSANPIPASAEQNLIEAFSQPDLISDDHIDYAALAAESEEGSVSFSPSDYANDGEMMAAVEAYLMKCWNEAPNETAA